MVEKPKEGICSQCGTEELEFYDDGTGSCSNCGRVFRWDHETSKDFIEEHTPSDIDDEIDDEGSILPRFRKNRGFTPSRPPAVSSRIKPKKGFLYICITGIILLIVGYVLIFGSTIESVEPMEDEVADDTHMFIPIALMLNCIGVLVLSLGLIYGAATAEQLDGQIRAWMILAMAIILGLFLTFGTSFMFNML